MTDGKGAGLFFGFFVLVLALSVFGSCYAPCGCFRGTPSKDVPARCTDTFKGDK